MYANIYLSSSPQRRGKIDERYSSLYEKLREIRNQLEKLELTHSWSMREIDLYSYQCQLDQIDESRVEGNFLDAEGKPADLHSQRVSFYDSPSLIMPNSQFRLFYILFDAVMHTSGIFLSNLNRFQRPCYLFTINFKLYEDV